MINADLYLGRVNFLKYLPGTNCQECGESSCADLARQLKKKTLSPAACPFLTGNQIGAFQIALQANEFLPQVPALDLPRPAPAGLVEVNRPDEHAPLLVSGNSEFTQEVLIGIIALTLSPFWLLFVDCRGDTVDMAMLYESLTEAKLLAGLAETPLAQGPADQELILPGLAARFKQPMERQVDKRVLIGPVCVAELPLFLGDKWQVATDLALA